MSKDKYLTGLSHKKLFRVMAWICIVIILVLFIATVITGILGSKFFLPCLALMIIIPFFMYIAIWIGRVLYGMNPESKTVFDDENHNEE